MSKLAVLVISAIAFMTPARGDDSSSACGDMRDELESMTPPLRTDGAWNDIEDLETSVESG